MSTFKNIIFYLYTENSYLLYLSYSIQFSFCNFTIIVFSFHSPRAMYQVMGKVKDKTLPKTLFQKDIIDNGTISNHPKPILVILHDFWIIALCYIEFIAWDKKC